MSEHKTVNRSRILIWILLIVVLAVGGYLRLVGMDWDGDQHLHPDERFLTMVESSISPVDSLSGYFDTGNSSLNPNNRGHGFYVYGTLPLFMVRYVAEFVDQTGYGGVHLVGRTLSAVVDLLSVFVVYLIGSQLFNRRVGVLSAAFSAVAVLQIQQSHFFTVDTFVTFFTVLTFYFAVEVATARGDGLRLSSFVLFGLSLGMAGASKINSIPVAITLPAAALLFWWRLPRESRSQEAPRLILYVVLAGLISFLAFRVFQPYAFSGPGLLRIKPNQQWIEGLKSLRAQTTGDVDFPPALQWARRPLWFSLKNMVLWGLGLPYGILAWVGFGYMGYRMIKDRILSGRILLLGWTALYFMWQSAQWNSTMRYQLPIYPLLGVFAGWFVIHVWDRSRQGWQVNRLGIGLSRTTTRVVIAVTAGAILLASLAWAVAFTRIYTRPHPRVEATRWIFDHLPGPVTLTIHSSDRSEKQLLSYPADQVITRVEPWQVSLTPRISGQLTEILLPRVQLENQNTAGHRLKLELASAGGETLRSFQRQLQYDNGEAEVRFSLVDPLPVEEGNTLQLTLSGTTPESAFSLQGTAIANESSWDDGLPLRMDGYDPFGGIYEGGLNFEMYWDDNQEKRDRFLNILDQTEYILITSSRQWASTTRVPERYPMTTRYYRELMGCPLEITVERCYNIAQPGTFSGKLGFELIKVFQTHPRIGPLSINDQFAEEAFTVYDHPKVFILRKTEAYDSGHARQILESVDLSKVVHLTPKEADNYPGNLMLPPARLAEQRQGGTWDRLFDVNALINRSQVVGVMVWYLTVSLLGFIVYPLVKNLLGGLADYGYPFARTAGMLLLSFGVWIAGSFRIPFSRPTITIVFLVLVLLSAGMAALQWKAFKEEWQERKNYFLIIEGIALAVFILGILFRYGNPDLWHPWKGGEKPMDFSYFNAVLKSTSFPPFDPWFAGGYINYYYYGFVFVGVLVKWLGLVPAFAYNLILPTLLVMMSLGAFSVTWNLVQAAGGKEDGNTRPYRAGLAGMLGMVFVGNLGVLRMMYRGFQRLAAGGGDLRAAAWFTKLKWAGQGLVRFVSSASFPYRLDEWYWNPSRAIAAEHGGPITEFPAFTFIYGDLHAHLIALPLTLLVLGWAISTVLNHIQVERRSNWGPLLLSTAFGSLAVGVLRPTNTWDFYPYLALGVVSILYVWWQASGREVWQRGVYSVGHVALYVGLAFLFFQPYSRWYGQSYTTVQPWTGSNTPLGDYLTHWGLFLFIILTWMAYETIHWMAVTPVSALRKLEDKRELILAAFLLLVVVTISQGVPLKEGIDIQGYVLLGSGVHIAWLVLPVMAWAGVLLLRPGISTGKRMTIFLIGTGLALTLMVEIIHLTGDIGRMNTVFKFYLQTWTLLSLSAAAGLYWLWRSFQRWPRKLQTVWRVGFAILIGGAVLYPLMGGLARIRDRMERNAPHTLDGMRYMAYAEYQDLGVTMDLSQDYDAIRWMQENVAGSPVIVEANQVEYHWGTRYTIYTGLPGVVGWNWHQRQQRNLTPHSWVADRVTAVNEFYNSTDLGQARDFLETYDVRYIVVGQLEEAKYAAEGLEKFPAAEGVLWSKVYERDQTTLYEVMQSK